MGASLFERAAANVMSGGRSSTHNGDIANASCQQKARHYIDKRTRKTSVRALQPGVIDQELSEYAAGVSPPGPRRSRRRGEFGPVGTVGVPRRGLAAIRDHDAP